MATTYADEMRGEMCQVTDASSTCGELSSNVIICGRCFAVASVCLPHAIAIDVASAHATCPLCGCDLFKVKHLTDTPAPIERGD